MKFRFVTQPYQQEAVNNICKVFKGQPHLDMVRYTRDLGIKKNHDGLTQTSLFDAYEENDDGFENAKILLEETDILDNIIPIILFNCSTSKIVYPFSSVGLLYTI